MKWGGALFKCELPHSPIDVVAWHGNYAPYKYDLRHFSPVGAISFDHPDPSIFTVLTSPSETAGTANIDFVIFPERWAVAENTFRPPWYHMNIMSEFMGLIYGVYDAKPVGLHAGRRVLAQLHAAARPRSRRVRSCSNSELKPVKLTGTMAFMFETRFPAARHTVCGDVGELCRTTTPIAGRASRSGSIRTSRRIHLVIPGAREEREPGNPYSHRCVWIPGPTPPGASRNDEWSVNKRIIVPHPNDPKLRSFIPVDPASDFPIQNLPYGVFSAARPRAARRRRDRRLRARSLGAGAGRPLRLRRDRRVLASLAQCVHGARAEDLGEDAGADQRAAAPRPSGAARQ